MNLTISSLQGNYPVVIQKSCFEEVAKYATNKCFIVTDTNVEPLYLNRLTKALLGHVVNSYTVPAGEGSKSKENLFKIIDRLSSLGYNRSDTVLALGGGVVGDLTGLAAGLYMRGIRLIMVPTTLLAMVDSSCGGKVAINHSSGKNMIGMFYQPSAVIASLDVLYTLSPDQLLCGIGEMIKYGCIYDANLFDRFKDKCSPLEADVIARCVEIKNYYVSRDTLDKGLRMTLNFGHTIGHCVEKDTGMLHGMAVAVGMYKEALLGEKLGITVPGTSAKISELLDLYGLPKDIPECCNIAKYLLHDKKSTNNGITFAFIEEIGKSVLREISYDQLRKENLC